MASTGASWVLPVALPPRAWASFSSEGRVIEAE